MGTLKSGNLLEKKFPPPNMEQISILDGEKTEGGLVCKGFETNSVKPTSFMNKIHCILKNTFVNVTWKVFITIQ